MQGAQTSFSMNRGVGRYTIELAKAMAKNSGEHEILLALNGAFPQTIDAIRAEFDGLLPQENIRVWQQFFDTTIYNPENSSRSKVGEILREGFLNSLEADIIFSTNLQEGLFDAACTSVKILPTNSIICSTLHDVIPLIYPDRYLSDSIIKEWYQGKIEFVKRSDIVLTDSCASRDEINRLLGIPLQNIHIIYPAVNHDKFKPIDIRSDVKDKFLARMNISSPFVMYAGGNDLHKNLDILYTAFSKISVDILLSHQLVLVGGALKDEGSHYRKRFKKLGINDNVVFVGNIADNELLLLYNLCELFIFPSIHEGFGLPPLEAMACGAAVIASSLSSLPEVVGSCDALFDPYDEEDLVRKIEHALTDKKFSATLKEHGILQASKFSWEKSGKSLLKLFEEILKKNFPPSSNSKKIDANSTIISHVASISPSLSIDDKDLIAISCSMAETFCMRKNHQLRLFVDVSAIIKQDDQTGIQRVTRAICSELIKNFKNIYVELIYATPHEPEFYSAGTLTNKILGFTLERTQDELIDFCQGDILLLLDFHPGVAISHRGKIQFLRNKGISVYHVVHDILPVLRPEFFWPELCSEFHEWLITISKSDGAICVSRVVAEEFAEWLKTNTSRNLRPFKIGWFHNGADFKNSMPTCGLPKDAHRVLSILALRPNFLMVGTIEPRKRHSQTLAAFEQLWAKGMDVGLVIVGKQGWNVETLADALNRHSEKGKRLFWLEGISDEYLEKVYAASACLVAASEGEGFGLPLIEAAQHKLPIIARDIPVFREVAGEHAFYFRGKEPDDLADAVHKWLELYKSDQHPKSDNLKWQTWEQSTNQILDNILKEEWYIKLDNKVDEVILSEYVDHDA